VPATTVQARLRALFATWGLPAKIRVDNGAPWRSWADLPTALALWWVGLGIEPVFNHPHCPKENPKVERCHGLWESWGEPQACRNFAAWEAAIAWVVETQRERYPSVGGRSRREAHPALAENPRRYTPEAEASLFDLERVKRYLALGRWPRWVSKIGQITLYGKPYRVGRPWAKQAVWVRLAAETTEWVIQDSNGEELIRHPAAQISAERICQLNVAHPRPPSRPKHRHNRAAPPLT
jgi:hypothetical protein